MTWDPPTLDFQASGAAILAANLNKMGNSLLFLERVAYVEFTAPVSVTATTEATANSLVSAGAITYEAVPHLIWFHAPAVANQSDVQLQIVLYDSTTALGTWNHRTTATGGTATTPMNAFRVLTPTAASHTYNFKAWTVSGTATVSAGAAGAGALVPGFIQIVRIPT